MTIDHRAEAEKFLGWAVEHEDLQESTATALIGIGHALLAGQQPGRPPAAVVTVFAAPGITSAELDQVRAAVADGVRESQPA